MIALFSLEILTALCLPVWTQEILWQITELFRVNLVENKEERHILISKCLFVAKRACTHVNIEIHLGGKYVLLQCRSVQKRPVISLQICCFGSLWMQAMTGQYLCNQPITVSYAYKKETKGERHGTPTGRTTS